MVDFVVDFAEALYDIYLERQTLAAADVVAGTGFPAAVVVAVDIAGAADRVVLEMPRHSVAVRLFCPVK